jgi:hypothetical protein
MQRPIGHHLVQKEAHIPVFQAGPGRNLSWRLRLAYFPEGHPPRCRQVQLSRLNIAPGNLYDDAPQPVGA